MRFQFIDDHCTEFEVQVMCRVLKVSRSGYYAWRSRSESTRAKEDAALWSEIEKVHDQSHGIYGYRRVREALIQLGIKASYRRVARLMRQHGCRGKQFRRYVTTTKPGQRLPEVPDLVQRQFEAEQPNQIWVSDITYVRTDQGWLYLAVILDLFARRVVGWAMLPTLSQALTLDALKMAFWRRQPPSGLIHHSDRGSQYTCHEYQQLLTAYRSQPSLGHVGSCFDNAAMESFFGTLKAEWLYFHRFETREQAMQSIFYYIEVFYNRQRLHSANGYYSPIQYEQLNASTI
jgi:putative transposase